MSHLLTWLTDNVRNAATKCGALSASVYVPTPWNDAAPGILVHVGESPLPEMADLERAIALADASEAHRAGSTTREAQPAILRSRLAEGCLIPIPMLAAHWRGASHDVSVTRSGEGPGRRLADDRGTPPVVGWLGLRFAQPPGPLHLTDGWPALLELAGALASTYVCFYGIVTDPVTGLPGRAELQGTLRAEIERAQSAARPFSLLFVKLEDLDTINQQHGRRAGDAALRELIDVLQNTLRGSDVVMRYGAATFALPLRDVTADGVMIVAGKIRRGLSQLRVPGAGSALTCAMGATSISGQDQTPVQPLDLLRRADQALGASCRDAERRPVLWRADDLSASEPLDPLLGVFTGQAETDYRNMRLLWEVLRVLASAGSNDLAEAAVTRIGSLFAAARVGLFQPGERGALQLVAGRHRIGAAADETAFRDGEVSIDERLFNERAFTLAEPQHTTIDAAAFGQRCSPLPAFALPLVVEGRPLGTLYLLSRADARKLDHNDLPVLTGVATHLALALDREQLVAQQRIRAEAEKARLRAEVARLQNAAQHTKLVFRSSPMNQLLDTTRRVAGTDATVLVTGESGTGKEMLAHTLHELSARHRKPLVIVDCGAIPASLMDSELFGRERGAYTGAERRAAGRLAQADGGTVFLDEIGELPLEVQAKLLRFVQERTLTMVGSTTAQRIDVRIIAATNRVLEHEVHAGRFREDLFHRLNVVRLRIPPLRERRDDILLLARHFLDAFAMQYGKPVHDFAPDAERALLEQPWGGNVRELQNSILQAVVLAQGDRITVNDLRLQEHDAPSPARITDLPSAFAIPRPAVSADRQGPPTGAWERLRDQVQSEVQTAARQGGRPVGKWLGYELVLRAYDESREILTRAAARVGLPDTTFVRRLRHAQAEAAHIRYPENWGALRDTLTELLRTSDERAPVADRLDDLVLDLVVAAMPGQVARAAAIVGVSAPTMKRRMLEIEEQRRTA